MKVQDLFFALIYRMVDLFDIFTVSYIAYHGAATYLLYHSNLLDSKPTIAVHLVASLSQSEGKVGEKINTLL